MAMADLPTIDPLLGTTLPEMLVMLIMNVAAVIGNYSSQLPESN